MSVVNKKKIIIGITGLIGDGKTEAAQYFKKKGIKVIDVDNFAHTLYKKNTGLYNKILKIYGDKIKDSNGKINREKLSKIVFLNDFEYRKFTSLIYPVLNNKLKEYINKLKNKIILVDMAVLFQSGFYKYTDIIIFIKTTERIWKNRFIKSKNYKLILKIRNIQKKYLKNFKTIALSDFILYNNTTKQNFTLKVNKIYEKIIKEGIYVRKRKKRSSGKNRKNN